MPDERVFLDTNGLIALLNAKDTRHDEANAAWIAPGRRGANVVLTDWIIAETGNGLARLPARSRFSEAIRRILASPRTRLVIVEKTTITAALDLYESRPDKGWGLVDCASMIVMKQEGIQDVFSSDHHFSQAGFRCLFGHP